MPADRAPGRIRAVRRHVAWAVAASTLLAAGLRLYGLGRESLWLDEMFSLQIARGGMDLVLDEAAVGREPLYYSLLVWWRRAFGESEAALRALSALAGIATIPLQYRVVSRIAGLRAGLASAFLLAIVPTQIHYAQETRAYTWLILLALGSQLALGHLLRAPDPRRWAAYFVVTAAMLYTHATGIFFLAAQNTVLAWSWMSRRRAPASTAAWLACQVGLVAVTLPILGEDASTIAAGTHGVQLWIPEASIRDLARVFHWHLFPSPAIVGRDRLFQIMVAAAAIGVAVACWPGAGRPRFGWQRWNALVILAILALIPIFGPFVLGEMYGKVFLPRYTLTAAPGLCGIAALLLVSLRPRIPDSMAVAATAFAIGVVLPRASTLTLKEPWRAAVRYVEARALPGDRMTSRPSRFEAGAALIDYYRRAPIPVCSYVWNELTCPSEPAGDAASGTRFWAFYRGAFSSPEVERARLEGALRRPVRRSEIRKFRDVGLTLLEADPVTPAADGSAVAAPPVAR